MKVSRAAKQVRLNRIAKVVRTARKKKGLTQEQLAELCDVVTPTVCGWETARHGIGVSRANVVAGVLDVPANTLIDLG